MFFYLSKLAWFVLTPSNGVGLLVAAGLASSAWHRGIGTALAGLGLAGYALFGFGPVGSLLLAPLENRFPPPPELDRVDGIIVLGGAVNVNVSVARGQLTTGEAGDRILALGDLARRHPEARLVFSGGSGSVLADEDAAEADLVGRFASVLGIAPGRVEAENTSRTTAENAERTRALVGARPGERWLLVTSAWHMPRAVGCFRRVGLQVVPYPVNYLTRGDGTDGAVLLGSAAYGLRRVDLAATEWVGLLAYRLSGRTDALFPGPVSASPSPASLMR